MLDLIIVLAFIVYAIISGFRAKDAASKDLKEYFLAGSTLKGWQAGISMAATQFAADTPLLVTGLIATGGIFTLWRLWIYGLAFIVMGLVFASKWRRAGVITDAELTEIRYSGGAVTFLRVLKAVYYGTVINCVVLAMVLVASTRIAEVFLPWHNWLPADIFNFFRSGVEFIGATVTSGSSSVDPFTLTTGNLMSIGIILGFTTLYSTTGGLRSVVATDVVQFGIAMLGTLVYAGYILYEVGGFGGISTKMVELYGTGKANELLSFIPSGGDAVVPFIVIIGLQWFYQMNSDGTGYLAQRSMGCESDREATKAALLFTWLQVFLRSIIWLIIGVGILIIYPFAVGDVGTEGFTSGREMLFITGINDFMPMGIKGIILTGLMGALASTIDTHLNWGASYWSNDIYKELICKKWRKRNPSDKELVWGARLSNLCILTIAVIVMFNLGSIQEAWMMSLLFGAGMGAVLVLRWIWERINLYSELSAIATSLIAAPIILVFVREGWLQLLLMASISTIVTIVVTLLTPPTEEETLKAFYQRVKPSGFWRKTATLLGEDASLPTKKFKTSMFTSLLIAISLFLSLYGMGKILVHTTDQTIIPGIIALIIGVTLVPVWYKRALGTEN